MQYFTVQAPSHSEAERRVRSQYGDQARILTHRTIRLGGFLGLFSREGIEVTGYLSAEQPRKKALDLEEEKKKILTVAKNDQTLQALYKEVLAIKDKLDEERAAPARLEAHPVLGKMEALLRDNEFSETYLRSAIDRLRRDFSLEQLEDDAAVEKAVVEIISDSIKVYEPVLGRRPYVFILVGPTGVGKTTTIAKLAALYGVSVSKPLQVRIITIDNYRIGAKQQIETYGEIMEIPVACAQGGEDLRRQVGLWSDADVIFVDTVGKSPHDFMRLAEMRKVLDSVQAESVTHLAMCATTKAADMVEIMQQFEPFQYRSVIVTKLDETTRVGNIISVLHERQKPVSFITDGQSVPQDIEKGSVKRLLSRVQGLSIRTADRERG